MAHTRTAWRTQGKAALSWDGWTRRTSPDKEAFSVKEYIGVVVVKAAPSEKNGKPGYKVLLSSGAEFWISEAQFEESYRALDCERVNK